MHRTIHISKDLGLGPFSMDEKEPQVEIRRLVGETIFCCAAQRKTGDDVCDPGLERENIIITVPSDG